MPRSSSGNIPRATATGQRRPRDLAELRRSDSGFPFPNMSRKLKAVIYGSLASIGAAWLSKFLELPPDVAKTVIYAILGKAGIQIWSQASVDREEFRAVADIARAEAENHGGWIPASTTPDFGGGDKDEAEEGDGDEIRARVEKAYRHG